MLKPEIMRTVTIAIAVVATVSLARASDVCVLVEIDSDAPIRGALVTVTSLMTNNARTATGDAVTGKVCFTALPEGLYSVEASSPGFLNARYYPVHLFPGNPINLTVRLPFGEVTEGGVSAEALIVGTLRIDKQPIANADFCLMTSSSHAKVACGRTSSIGEYAIYVSPGVYDVRVTMPQTSGRPLTFRGKRQAEEPKLFRIDASAPGTFLDRLEEVAP